MESSIPLLNPQQIQQLNNMIHGILGQNKKKLDDILSQLVQVENTSILNLYKLVVEEWQKKQKIIDNLCHFSLTMMSTVHLLWDQKYDYQQKLNNAQTIVENLQNHLDELSEENLKYKLKINQAQTHIQSISGEKEKFEQLYKSQSCCNFIQNGYLSDIQLPNSHISKQCIDCQHKSLLEKQRQEFFKENSQNLIEKDGQINLLKKQKEQLQKKFEELIEEHQLVKMEIELAEIAVKDALSYRQSSISNNSVIMSRGDEIYTTKSHAQFMNGDLECFSNLDQSFNLQRKQTLAHEINSEHIIHFVSNPQISSQKIDENEQKINQQIQYISSPFKKKSSKKNEERRYNTQVNQQTISHIKSSVKQIETKIAKDKKTVSLQCNLLKNVPKIQLFSKKVIQTTAQIKAKQELKQIVQKKPKKVINKMTQSMKVFSKSQIIKPSNQNQNMSSLSRFYNFISSKIVTNRIKLK